MGEYKLSASLEGHEDDVRDVAFPHPKFLYSASRDSTVRLWKLLTPSPPTYDCSISSNGSGFVNAIAYVRPSKEYPNGLVVSGGKDTIIEVRQPEKSPEDNAEGLLLGHAHNVCALDVSPDGKRIISGSWDGTARVWQLGKWEGSTVLGGHEGSVWSVLAYDNDTILTACADKLIRIFTPTGKLLHTIKGNLDVVRALCKIPRGHDSKADFASAGNDGIIRLWHLSGRQAGELIGHENFIYSLASLPNGDIVSSGEDRTLRIWRGSSCIQTITHPAISVWAVAVCSETGDIASGASDRILRVFTQSRDRYAEPETINAFEESVKSSSIPQQQVGDINKEKLPGPEFLVQKSGTKEGQVTMIKQPDGSVTAHQWSQSAQEWLNVGTVVDAVGSSGKKMDYLGKDYDYVFDVDIEEGKPPLKLPYNLSQNPFEAARKFIEDNELPMTYLDEVSNFITSNTQGATIGQTSQPPPVGSDPWGTESRYRPGDASSSSQAPPPPSAPKRARVLPQKEYLSIKTANLKMIEKKIVELSDQLKSEGQSDVALDAPATATLQTLMAELGRNQVSPSKGQDYVNLVTLMSVHWPAARRLPGLDLLRLLAAHSPAVAQYEDTTGRNAVELLESTGVFGDSERPNNTMLAVRVLANLFETEPGRSLMDSAFDQVQNILGTISTSSANRNLQVAIATLSINYTVFVTSDAQASAPQSMDRGISMMHGLTTMLSNATDPEEAYRCLVAAGTLLSLGEEVGTAANDIYDLGGVLKKVEKGFDEPRIKGMVMEISDLLK